MATNYRTWDNDILEDMFNTRDQQCIRRVTLREKNNEDVVYWGKEASVSIQSTVHTDSCKNKSLYGDMRIRIVHGKKLGE